MGAFQIAAGLLILSPLVFGWAWLASGIGCLAGIGSLFYFGRSTGTTGRPMRRLTIAALVLTLLFMAWERNDPATQALGIVAKANQWRAHELDWQLTHDLESPKVGDLAPDFELEDPGGAESIRLSSFTGKRPVALVFGSYT